MTRIGLFLGGISSERNVSLESGKNVYEKLVACDEYQVIPIFVSGTLQNIKLYIISIGLLQQDNVDQLYKTILNFKEIDLPPELCKLREQYGHDYLSKPLQITFDALPNIIDYAFIALHGRPGEDGTIQRIFDKLNIPYNGASADTSHLTIDKYATNRLLHKHGIYVANQYVIDIKEWNENKYLIVNKVEQQFKFPFIVKPVDDGSSTGVMIINDEHTFCDYVDTCFRIKSNKNLNIPYHERILVEDLITIGEANKLLEISGGFVTHYNNGKLEYEIFSPSETVAMNGVLTMEEKFISGEGQNITPARYSNDQVKNDQIDTFVKGELLKVAQLLKVEGYGRIDAMVKVFTNKVEVWVIEVNTLPALTPATCLFHQCILNGYTPTEFIKRIINQR